MSPARETNAIPDFPSPIDYLGLPNNCCRCIPLKVGVVLICLVSFVWAVLELISSEKLIASMFSNKNSLLSAAKVLHVFIVMFFLLSCGLLMLGIYLRKSMLIHFFVWSGFVFNCICIALDVVSLAFQAMFTEHVTKKTAMVTAFCVIWHCIFFYFLSVVNSFKFSIMWI
ncbi:uncharacterized protein LOC113495315 [Trichoplusia ni]|uniref:Uncharacterized protein LOC113495315 n=1 Tax=Trichoplusia ni TaxID=7111 RepID=A0A7E5VND2_TRINI|nr:uncharacterized protein LOC113495315 [Trichoplusia ni]